MNKDNSQKFKGLPNLTKVKSQGSNASTELTFENTRLISNGKGGGGAGEKGSANNGESSTQSII